MQWNILLAFVSKYVVIISQSHNVLVASFSSTYIHLIHTHQLYYNLHTKAAQRIGGCGHSELFAHGKNDSAAIHAICGSLPVCISNYNGVSNSVELRMSL